MKIILVVDDEFGITEALGSLLGDEGYHVLVAVNGEQGMEKLASLQPDLMMIDYMMPIMDGAKMLEAIRNQAKYAELPIILMSGVAEATARLHCHGYSAFLRKPLRAEAVLQAIARLLPADS
jgi:CheY-like chemotaxis protein